MVRRVSGMRDDEQQRLVRQGIPGINRDHPDLVPSDATYSDRSPVGNPLETDSPLQFAVDSAAWAIAGLETGAKDVFEGTAHYFAKTATEAVHDLGNEATSSHRPTPELHSSVPSHGNGFGGENMQL
jgi:hypothetical protein